MNVSVIRPRPTRRASPAPSWRSLFLVMAGLVALLPIRPTGGEELERAAIYRCSSEKCEAFQARTPIPRPPCTEGACPILLTVKDIVSRVTSSAGLETIYKKPTETGSLHVRAVQRPDGSSTTETTYYDDKLGTTSYGYVGYEPKNGYKVYTIYTDPEGNQLFEDHSDDF